MPARLFHDSQYDWSRTVDSFWESERRALPPVDTPSLDGDATSEVAIIGGGYCGLSAAYHLARAGIEARVLEAGDIGWGASGRNGGFCSIGGSWLGPEELSSTWGEDEMLAFYRALIDAVRLVDDLTREESIDVRRQGDGVWTFAHKPKRAGDFLSHVEVLKRLDVNARILSADGFARVAFGCSEQFGALFEPVGFGLHPLAYCLGLARAAHTRGAVLNARSRVSDWRKDGVDHVLATARGSVRAKRVVVAANGWLPEELHPAFRGRVLPALSNIITTRPLSEAELQAQDWCTELPASNTRNRLAYLRLLPDRRLLFGGRGDTTGSPSGGIGMRTLLTRQMGEMFPAFAGVEITHSWRGFITATTRLTPAIGELPDDPSVSFAFGCHGNGVALMTWAGRELAKRIAGTADALPAPFRGLPDPFPLPSTRLWQLRALLWRAWFEDEFR
jgi:glycine/D-amino acid oxidase-like deaminating enzyme